MNWTVQYAEYYLYRGVSRTNAYEFMQQSVQIPRPFLARGETRIGSPEALNRPGKGGEESFPEGREPNPDGEEVLADDTADREWSRYGY